MFLADFQSIFFRNIIVRRGVVCSLLSLGTAFLKAFIITLLWQATQTAWKVSLCIGRFQYSQQIKVMYIVDMDIEQFKLMKVEELQSCLRLRRLRVTGKER